MHMNTVNIESGCKNIEYFTYKYHVITCFITYNFQGPRKFIDILKIPLWKLMMNFKILVII